MWTKTYDLSQHSSVNSDGLDYELSQAAVTPTYLGLTGKKDATTHTATVHLSAAPDATDEATIDGVVSAHAGNSRPDDPTIVTIVGGGKYKIQTVSAGVAVWVSA